MPQLRAAAQPTTLGRYTLLERVGSGGQGEVWRAHDESRGVDIALKVLPPAAARTLPCRLPATRSRDGKAATAQHHSLSPSAPEGFESAARPRPVAPAGGILACPLELAPEAAIKMLERADWALRLRRRWLRVRAATAFGRSIVGKRNRALLHRARV